MSKLAIIVASACLLSCSAIQTKKTVETAVDVGVEACHKLQPSYAWICDLSDRAIDALIEQILPGGMMMIAPADKGSKMLLLQDLLIRVNKMRAARDASGQDMSENFILEQEEQSHTFL